MYVCMNIATTYMYFSVSIIKFFFSKEDYLIQFIARLKIYKIALSTSRKSYKQKSPEERFSC